MKKIIIKKTIAVIFLLLFFNLIYIIRANEIYLFIPQIVSLILANLVMSVDISIRPSSSKKNQSNSVISILFFLLLPIMAFLPYFELQNMTFRYITVSLFKVLSVIGVIFVIIGGIILLISRIQLGKYGSSKVVLEDDHKLITNGLYHHIRNPIYLGFLTFFFGYMFSFGGFISILLILTPLFLFFKQRMNIEEKLLISLFEDEYISYVKRTKKLIPLIY
ncbi:isoprenylcysteine carboxylmethyltransferase family protein [Promethearchaeum syntrophicum]|uniref:Isoprenylcysteine carboxylmethyltransferase family protein n=1 Tax=Promethearchaeum syntrophicum TaxID=2594042 RepID=A0A5B9DH12_9ARCH|nr:isoprenylcysteine carboxylmethyltransferase family protein [Candidatus Prometheoarchaeum syntrophicum]QEE17996.1 Isoprenylcysteine carboxyl methyltransferase (ICMT) family protein [Candidatus Prometheoarchaeum syntrophicum]